MERKSFTDKPQGFDIGRLQKLGIHHCFYNCGLVFDNKKDAKHHVGCKGAKQCEKNIDVMYALNGKTRSKNGDGGGEHFKDSDNRQVSEGEESGVEGCDTFGKQLNTLPIVEDRMKEVENYLRSLPTDI